MTEAKKYTCNLTKNELVNAIIEQFEKVNAEYTEALKSNNSMLQDRSFGKYIAMIELLEKVRIYD